MKYNKIKLLTEILAIVAIVLISFVGVYKQKDNRMSNQIKEYQFSKDLDGYREILLEVVSIDNSSEAEPENSENISEPQDENNENEITKKDDFQNNYENFVNAKKIIENRLDLLGVQDYNISQNTENGSIYLQLPENSETDNILGNILQSGKLEIKDSEDSSKLFVNNDNIKKVVAQAKTSNEGMTIVYLRIKFDKEGEKTLKEISLGEYKTNTEETKTENQNSENTEVENSVEAEVKTDESEGVEVETSSDEQESEENKDNQKKVKLIINDDEILTSSFDDPIENGEIDLTMNKPTDNKEVIKQKLKYASTLSSILNSGTMPLEYEIKQNSYIQTDINQSQINMLYIVIGVVFVIALIVLILRYKVKGVIAVLANIGFVALYLLVIRYTNVVVSLECIFTGAIVLAINYLLVNDFLKMQENTKLLNVFKSQIIKVLPIVLVAIIFSFMKFTKFSTCGMFLFWGILVSFIYNYILTRDMIIRKEVDIDEK